MREKLVEIIKKALEKAEIKVENLNIIIEKTAL